MAKMQTLKERHEEDAEELVSELKRKGGSGGEAKDHADEYSRKAMKAQREGRLDEAADLHRATSHLSKHAAEQFGAEGDWEEASRYRNYAADSAKAATKMDEESEKKRKSAAPAKAAPQAEKLKAFAEETKKKEEKAAAPQAGLMHTKNGRAFKIGPSGRRIYVKAK